MDRNEYLQRPLIEGVVYEVTDESVMISSPHTIYIIVRKESEVPLSEVESQFRKLKKEAKESGKVRLNGVTKFLPTIRSLYPSYRKTLERTNTLFDEVVKMIPEFEADGLHMGCTDDELLKEIRDKEWEISNFHNLNTDYSRYLRLYHNVKNVLTSKPWRAENLVRIKIRIA